MDRIYNLVNSNNNPGEKKIVSICFLSYIESRKRDLYSMSLQRGNWILFSDPKKKADILNRQYCSVFDEDSTQPPSRCLSQSDLSLSIQVTSEGVRKLSSGLNPNMANGPDKIIPLLYRKVKHTLAPQLTNIVQSTITHVMFHGNGVKRKSALYLRKEESTFPQITDQYH